MITKNPYKLAIIGGSIDSAVGYTHFIASQMDHRWELVAANFSKNPVIHEKTVQAWNIAHIRHYFDWKKLLHEEVGKIDAVAILTPTPQHYEMIMSALDYGYAIISEKALASNYQEGLAICKKLEEKKGFLAVTHNYTGYPMLRELKSQVDNGQLGKLIQIQIEMPQEGFLRLSPDNQKPAPQAWRLTDGIIPGVSLDLGAHIVHMVQYISGESPYEVFADQRSFGCFPNIIDDVSAICNYPSGMKGVFWYGKSALGHRNGLRIRAYGTKGSAEWFQMEPEVLKIFDVHGNTHILDRAANVYIAQQSRYNRFKVGHPAGFLEAFANLYFDFAEKMGKSQEKYMFNKDWIYGVDVSVKGLQILENFVRSSQKKSWIAI